MEFNEHMEALQMAIENEAREAEFYRKHSERTTNPLGKKMFVSLAHDEMEHMEKLKALSEKLRSQGRWPDQVSLTIAGTRVKEVLESFPTMAESASKADRDDLDAVRVAMEFEEKGEAFYRDLAKRVRDPKEKEFFEILASLEHEHLLSLRDTWEYFKNPEGWFRVRERHTIDGA